MTGEDCKFEHKISASQLEMYMLQWQLNNAKEMQSIMDDFKSKNICPEIFIDLVRNLMVAFTLESCNQIARQTNGNIQDEINKFITLCGIKFVEIFIINKDEKFH